MSNMNKLLNVYRHLANKKLFILGFLLMTFNNIFAQDATTAEAPVAVAEPSMWSSPLLWVFVFAIIALLLVIVAIGSVLVGLVNNKISEKFGKGAAVVAIALMFASSASHAQDAATTTQTNSTAVEAIVGGLDQNTVIILSIVVLIELFVIVYLYSILQRMMVALGYKEAKESSWSWKSISRKMTNAVPIEKESEVATDHNYDGIIELDNSLPPWWVYMFYATIVFSFVYVIYFHYLDGPSQADEYNKEIELASLKKTEMLKQTAGKVDENSVTLLTEAADIAKGKSSFITKCAACHGQAGEGGVGPNLTDEYWIHGGSISDIFKTIKYGVQEKGMIAWEAQMQPTEMQQVSSFIMSLKGTNPANAKAPQGDLYKADAAATVDTTAASASADSTVAMNK
jgi:cytochrome c oxidase cbb3-type subunit 3